MHANESLLQASQYLQELQRYWWPFCRIMAMLAMAPLLNHRSLPRQVRILLAIGLTLALAGALPRPPAIEALSAEGLLAALEQIAVGAVLGLALQLVFVIFSLVGEVVSTQMGMAMARYNDPVNGVSSSSVVGQLYLLLLALLFLASDGHLLVVSVLYQSFHYWPVGGGLAYAGFATLAYALAWVFSAATLISLPLAFCMFLVQFCFGLLNRISAAMNLFSLGFPMAILTGLACIRLTLPDLPDTYLQLTRALLDNLGQLLRGTGHG